jgi:hypothetical protein
MARKKTKEKNKTRVDTYSTTLPLYSRVWAIILLSTFITAVGSIIKGFDYYGQGSLISGIFFLIFSIAILFAVYRHDKKLLMWAGLLEFIVLLLPLLTFETQPEYLPYSINIIFVFTFPVLWVLLPIGIFQLLDSPHRKERFMQELTVMTLIIALLWVLSPTFSYPVFDWEIGEVIRHDFLWNNYLVFLPLLIIPLVIWLLEYRHAIRSEHAAHPNKGIYAYAEKNLPELLLVLGFILILTVGFAINYDYMYYDCGDGICDYDEDSFTCPEDCGYCGDGWCDLNEEGFCEIDCGHLYHNVHVYIPGEVNCSLRVSLYNSFRELIGTKEGDENQFVFTGVDWDRVYARASPADNNESAVYSPPIDYYYGEDTINLTLPMGFCS